jgi:hypothetical protein
MASGGDAGKDRSGPPAEEFINSLIKSLPQLTGRALEDFDSLRDLQQERRKKELEIGWFGRLVGDSDHAPSNIVAMIVLICAVALMPLIYALITKETTSPIVASLASTLLTTMTTCGGYLFGRSARPAARRRRDG